MKSKWQKKFRLAAYNLPRHLRQCLLTDGAMMRHLNNYCRDSLRLEVKKEYWRCSDMAECQLLDLQPGVRVYERAINLYCRDSVWLYAQSVMPRRTVQQFGTRILKLGNKPLGQILFAERTLIRLSKEFMYLPHSIYEHPCAIFGQPFNTPVCGRRSVFLVRKQRLILTEWFLTDFIKYPIF